MNNKMPLPPFVTDLGDLWTDPNAGALFTAALTRRAWLEENPGTDQDDHEALEWLGDRVLNSIVAEELWRRFPFASPGRLDLLRKDLCGETLLAAVARRVDLHPWIRQGRGELRQRQAATDGSLSDHVEALLGAARLAGGWEGAEALASYFLEGSWPDRLPEVEESDSLDPMSELNHLITKTWKSSLSGDSWVFEEFGEDNHRERIATVTLPDGETFTGERVGGKKGAAKASAAAAALPYLRRRAGQ